jgi:Phosphotransferase enzyme family
LWSYDLAKRGVFCFLAGMQEYISMTSDINLAVWQQPAWHEAVREWIHTQLAHHKITVSAAIEQIHLRPWSTVLRVPTSQGNVFFKASMAMLAPEAALTQYLANLKVDFLPQLLAVDVARGWMLLRDGGERLREALQANPDLKRWEELLPTYAKLQIELSKHLKQIEKLNVPNWRLARLPQLYQSLLAETSRFRIDMENGITAQQYQQLTDLLDVINAKCEQLARYHIPEAVHHGDFHDGNIFFNAGQYVFFDWGDCSISHPFFSLRSAYVSAEIRFNLEENAPPLKRLRDAYLASWREFETEARLHEAFGLAQELWAISSMLNWHRTISNLDAALQPEYAHILPGLAQELLAQIKD